jgi:hypothetical protein
VGKKKKKSLAIRLKDLKIQGRIQAGNYYAALRARV